MLAVLVSFGALFSIAQLARAGCSIDFEDLALGTTVTNQYRGVAFSVVNPAPLASIHIQNPTVGTTSSGTKCLQMTPGDGEEYLRMVFTAPHNRVSFFVGDQAGISYTIRYYSTASGDAGLIDSFSVFNPSPGGVHAFVSINSSATPVLRVEVQSNPGGYFEAIDDLTFEADTTPPIAEISYPGFNACICASELIVRGRTCDDDGEYGADVLEYAPVTGGGWLPIGSYTSPACDANSWLYTWNTSLVPEGTYYLRLTVTNKCGLSTNDVTVVTLDRSIDAAAIRRPTAETILGGTVCIDGFAYDRCFKNYLVEYKPEGGGSFQPVDPAHATYTTPVSFDPLASWNTANNTTPDGRYVLRVTTSDTCDHAASQEIAVTVDNTAPLGAITSPVQCSKRAGVIPVYGTAFDANLSSWVLQYSDLNTHGWTDIANGTSAATGLLANWDTTSLPACAYALRLVVTDRSQVNMDCSGSAGANQTIYMLTLDVVKSQLEQDTDGDGMLDVWEARYLLNPNDPSDAALDSDNDGATNLAEFLAGTDPRDPNSNLRITAVSHAATDTSVTWTSSAGHHYLVEETPTPDSGNFSTVSPLISVPSDGSTTFVHEGATGPSGFYRVILVK